MLEIKLVQSQASGRSEARLNSGILVYGRFSVNEDNTGFDKIDTQTINHLACVVSRGGNYQSFSPLSSKIFFADDLTKMGEKTESTFEFDLDRFVQFYGRGRYFVLCSMGTLTSNIESFDLD